MSEVIEFPTPRERAGVSMLEDMDMLLDALVGAAIALKNSENVAEEDREGDVEIMTELLVKYFNVRGERYPSEEEGE